MASRRNLKKHINYVTDVIAGLCMLECMEATGEKKKEYRQLSFDIMDTRWEMISRISHTEPGNVKGFYKKLHSDFSTQTQSFFKRLEELAQK